MELSISPSSEYSGLISFRINWFDLLAVQETLKSLLQCHNSKASILWLSAFFIVQHSYLYMTAGKTIALIIWTFVGKVMSLLFNTMSKSKTQHSKTKDHDIQSDHFTANIWGNSGNNDGLYFLGLQNHCRWCLQL